MKAFKSWWLNRKMKDYLWGDYGSHEDTWRACAEWFYTKLDHSQEHEELKDLLEQELEDTDGP